MATACVISSGVGSGNVIATVTAPLEDNNDIQASEIYGNAGVQTDKKHLLQVPGQEESPGDEADLEDNFEDE